MSSSGSPTTAKATTDENERRIEAWKEQKVVEWHKGGKLRDRFPDVNEFRAWMETQILKAKQKAATKNPNPEGVDSDGKRYRNLGEIWEKYAKNPEKGGKHEIKKDNKGQKKRRRKGLRKSECQSRTDWYQKGKRYWQNAPPTLEGVLGGFGHISPLDIQESKKFIKSLPKGVGRTRAVDLGAGIGRVASNLLLGMFSRVDIVEQDKSYVDAAKAALSKVEGIGSFDEVGLQDYKPDKGIYDVMWFQWVLGHLPDDDLVELLSRCRAALAEGGVLVVKENMSRKGFILDKEDMSVTRTEGMFRELFIKAGLKIVKEAWQSNFPKELFPVKMFALR